PQQQSSIPGQTDTGYDGAGRKIARIFRVYGTERWRTSYTYGGDHVDVTPPAGGTPTTTDTDARRNTTNTTQSNGSTPDTASYGYAPSAHLTPLADPAGNRWTWTYDLLGRPVAASDPDRGAATSGYDDAGRLVSTTDARNVTLAYTYD